VAPDVSVTLAAPGGNSYSVGDPITYNATVCDGATAGDVTTPNSITVTGVLPAGLTGIAITGTNWTLNSLSSTTSPATYTATYTGAYPLLPGQCLSPLVISGTITPQASGGLNSSIGVTTPGDTTPGNNTTTVGVTVTAVTPTPGITPTPTLAPLAPDIAVTLTNPGGSTYTVGNQLVYNATICDEAAAGPVTTTNSIIVSGVLPLGLTGITITGTGWTVTTLTSTIGPALYTATYTGTYPLPAGQCLPPLVITGTTTPASVPGIATSISVNTPGDTNLGNNVAVSSVIVLAPAPTPGVTETPTPGVTPTPTPLSPDVSVQLTNQGGSTYTVGDPVVYNATVCNVLTAKDVTTPNSITVTGVIQLGLTGVAVNGTGWTITSLSSTTGPASYTATYTGRYPVQAGGCLPPLLIRGTLTPDSVPAMTSSVTVSTPGDENLANNTAVNTIVVNQGPDLAVTRACAQGSTLHAGQLLSYSIVVNNVTGAGSVVAPDPIVVTNVLSVGVVALRATGGPSWDITVSSVLSPAIITARYTGPYPVTPGATLPVIRVTGIVTNAAAPSLDCAASVSTPADNNFTNNTLVNTIGVIARPCPCDQDKHNGRQRDQDSNHKNQDQPIKNKEDNEDNNSNDNPEGE